MLVTVDNDSHRSPQPPQILADSPVFRSNGSFGKPPAKPPADVSLETVLVVTPSSGPQNRLPRHPLCGNDFFVQWVWWLATSEICSGHEIAFDARRRGKWDDQE